MMEILEQRKLAVLVGPGGVGKTTLAAAMGVRAAQAGRRVLVLTADPARRLSAVLGVDRSMDAPVQVHLPGGAPGTLHAAMVTSRRVFDRLLQRLLPPQTAEALLTRNRMYAAFARTLARSHAYAAIEHLYHSQHESAFDLVILDTPPAEATVAILDAPTLLRRFLDGAMARIFGAPRRWRSSRVGRFLSQTAARRGAARVLGAGLFAEAQTFFHILDRVREAVRGRAEKVHRVLCSDATAFVLAAAPSPIAMAVAHDLADDLVRRGLAPAALVANRAYEVLDPDAPDRVVTAVAPDPAPGVPPGLAPLARRARALRSQAARRNGQALARIDALSAALPSPLEVAVVPRLDGTRHDVEGLAQLGAFLEPRPRPLCG